MTLPTELSEPAENLGDYSILLYGEKKIGKSTIAAQFPDALLLMFEPGGRSLRAYQRPVRDWAEFKSYLKLLKKDKRFRTVVVDTADRMFKMCFEYMCKEKLFIEHPGDENDFGKSWGRIADEFASAVNGLLATGKGVLFISHAREEEANTKMGRKFSRMQPTMSGQARSVLEAIVDIWMYYGYEGSKRVLVLRGDEFIAAGHRLEDHFQYTDGKPIRHLVVEGSPAYAYERFVAAFENRIVRKTKPVKTKKGEG